MTRPGKLGVRLSTPLILWFHCIELLIPHVRIMSLSDQAFPYQIFGFLSLSLHPDESFRS